MRQGGKYDAIVIGGGPAGLSAGLWLARYRCAVRILDAEDPRNAATWAVHGYPGLSDPAPEELRRATRQQAIDAGAEYEPAVVVAVDGHEDDFQVRVEDGRVFSARRVLFATGLKDILPEIPGFEQFYGTSIWHCPECDGPSVVDCEVGILGWGKGIARYAMWMLTWTQRITILTHGHDPALSEATREALGRWNIPVRSEVIDRLEGDDGSLRRAVFHGGGHLDLDALFFHIASGPGSPLPGELGCKSDDDGILEVDGEHQTTVPGIYAAGDITPGTRLAIRAAYEGARAAIGIQKSLLPEDRQID